MAAVEERLLAVESFLWELPQLWTAVRELAAAGVGRWHQAVNVSQLVKVSVQAQGDAHPAMQPCCRYKEIWFKLIQVPRIAGMVKSLTIQHNRIGPAWLQIPNAAQRGQAWMGGK